MDLIELLMKKINVYTAFGNYSCFGDADDFRE